ncbi:hypothetical protein K505DRAFT_379281 [Melanomma pulvis-pyrius CBS 109.77]|uniref:Protein kinase domain-containing protein n=1 Tax=Melanomma pulvis-pyrius CBS 109.77 TaxID=1314802 RepID=A0A6A6WUK7_9PLEO|nr:hypothetical protein K505DRAFT_379281 [Melanomma pulvis-pyrius CBS 109.77]
MKSGIDSENNDEVAEGAEDGARIQYLWGPQDSFNYTEPSRDGATSAFSSEIVSQPGDFIALVTTISQAYRHNNYLGMRCLDHEKWSQFDRGSTFLVSTSNLDFRVVSSIDPNKEETVRNRVVIKRIKGWSMTESQVQAFNRELRVIDYFREAEHIVDLRGIGWFYNAESVSGIPEPVLMLEQAEAVLHDIVKGLSMLHSHDVVHGDIKLDNVLIFLGERFEEGVVVRSYHAKLSDFNLAMFDNGHRQRKLGGTPDYMAPESDLFLTFPQLKQTDVYSLGVLFAKVAHRTEDLRILDTTRAFADYASNIEAFTEEMGRRAYIEVQGSTFSGAESKLIMDFLTNTLRFDPRYRSLDRLVQAFNGYFNIRPRPDKSPATLKESAPSDLEISYGKFMDLSGNIKSRITDSLLSIAIQGDAEPRHAKALFELGVIHLSRYSDPVTSRSEGIKYIWQAAEAGDIRAQAFYGRLQSGFDCPEHPDFPHRRIQWLSNAIEAGIQVHFHELAVTDPHHARLALRRYGASCIHEMFSKLPAAAKTIFKMHHAAATDSIESIVNLLGSDMGLLNAQNAAGDTPLLTACRFGQFKAAKELLRRSAKASLSNNTKENGLHFLWRFTHEQAAFLVPLLLRRGADPSEEAFFSQRSQPWDLVPKLSGTPIERLAKYNRLDLVKLLIERGIKISPRNGNQLRRMLLLAVRLQNVAMQEFLIRYASVRDHDFNPGIRPLRMAGWEYKGRRRDFSDAAILGWARHTGSGIDVPLDFWQAAYHGKSWRIAMEATIDITQRLQSDQGFDEAVLDRTIQLAIREKAYNAFEHLMNLKILQTDGTRGRMRTLKPLCWLEGNLLLERPATNMNYVDQVHYDTHVGTLAQQAILAGDRLLFHILAFKYGANIALPFLDDRGNQINCYSKIGSCQHRDLWFVRQFQKLNIDHCCPYENAQQAVEPWRHPLADALFSRYTALAMLLVESGARISDPLPSKHTFDNQNRTILDEVFAMAARNPASTEIIHFLFPINDPQRSISWWIPTSLKEDGGYPVFRLVHDAVLHLDRQQVVPLGIDQIWCRLLEEYPLVDNLPRYKRESILSMTEKLYDDYFNKALPTMTFNINLIPGVGTRVTLSLGSGLKMTLNDSILRIRRQSIRNFFYHLYLGSPVDDLPVMQYIGSCLWLIGYFPSLRHPVVVLSFATALTGGLFLLILVGAIYWIIQHWGQLIRIIVALLLLLLAWISLCIAVFSGYLLLAIVLGFMGFYIMLCIASIIGVRGSLEGIFIDPEDLKKADFSWISQALCCA